MPPRIIRRCPRSIRRTPFDDDPPTIPIMPPVLRALRIPFHIFLVAAGCLLPAVPARAQDGWRELSGRWDGTYVCAQGETALRLDLRAGPSGVVSGVFRFSSIGQAEALNPEIPGGEYPVMGMLAGGALSLRPVDVRRMPGSYIPVGVLGSVAGRRMQGRIEGPSCTTFSVRKTADAAAGAPLPGGYGEQRWEPLAEEDAWAMYIDTRAAVDEGRSTARVWVRWVFRQADAGLGKAAGEMEEYDMEYDCAAGLARAWATVGRAPGGGLTSFDGSSPYRWSPVVKGTAEGLAFDVACAGR
jgi:hypothetical protein